MDDATILLGVLGRPHGVRGLMHVRSYTDDPEALVAYGPLTDERGEVWSLAWRGPGIVALARPDGSQVRDRDTAARLTNRQLRVPRSRLPEAGEGEFYLADLIGSRAEDEGGTALGHVVAVHEYGAGASLEIAAESGETLLVPFTRASVPVVDRAARRLLVVPPAVVMGEDPCGAVA